MSKNKQVSNRKNHINTIDQFIRECVDKGRTELKKVKSENNISDIVTKDIPVETFKINGEKRLNGEVLNESFIIYVGYDQIQRENVARHI